MIRTQLLQSAFQNEASARVQYCITHLLELAARERGEFPDQADACLRSDQFALLDISGLVSHHWRALIWAGLMTQSLG